MCVNIIRCSTVNLVRVRAEFVQCLIVSNPQMRNSSWQWKKHITYLHRKPFFIIFNRLSFWRQICFNKSVSCATERWEVWNVTFESRLLVPIAYSHGIWIETCVIKCLCESFWLHHFLVKFQINTEFGRSQRLIKVVFNELSLLSRIFRPTTDSAETSGSWRRHYDNTERKEKWDTEKNGYFDNAHVQCHHLREWIDAWVCDCRRYFRSILTPRIHGCSHKHYMGWSCSWSWWKKENFKAFRKKTFFSLVCMFFYKM